MNKSFLFMVDHKLRDLISIVIIKKYLQKLGHEVFLCRNGMELPFVIKKKIDVIIVSQVLTKSWRELALTLKKMGCKVVSLPTEGNPLEKKNQLSLANGNYLGFNNFLDLIFVWKKRIYDLTIKAKQINQKKVIYCGFHRLVSYSNKYFLLRKKIVKNYKKNNKINVTFATNFNHADYYDYPEKKYSKESNLKFAKLESIHRNDCIQFIKKILKEFKNLNIIIKVHPYEKTNKWTNSFSECTDKVQISVGDYIEGIIEQTDILIARNCHTLIESLALNKFILNLDLSSNPHSKIDTDKICFPTIKKIDDLKKYVNLYKKNSHPKFNIKILKDFKFIKGNTNSINIIVEELHKLKINKRKEIYNFIYFKNLFKYLIFCTFDYFFHDLFYLKNKKKMFMGRKLFVDSRERVEKHFHEEDVKKIENLI